MKTIKKGMEKKRVAPFDVSMFISDRAAEVHRRISEILMEDHRKTQQQVTSEANKLAYDLAEKTGQSIWNICLTTLPDYSYDFNDSDGRPGMVCKIKLLPIEFDFTHSPDYWEKKYYKLKNELQKLLDAADE